MRRKNRQIKLMVDIPKDFESEEEFMQCMAERLDKVKWQLKVVDPVDEEADDISVPISRASLNDIEITPEEDE